MPAYVYLCPGCDATHDIYKSIRDFDRKEYCPDCLGALVGPKVGTGYTKISVSVPSFSSHFSPAFGKVINSKSELRNEVRKYNDKTGSDLVEVGNEKPKSIKRDYSYKGDMKQIVQDMRAMRGR